MKRLSIVLVGTLACILLIIPVCYASSTSTASPLAGIGRGYAFAGYGASPASSSNGSGAINTGPMVPTIINCGLKPFTMTQTAAHLPVSKFLSSDSVKDVLVMSRTTSAITAQASSTVQNVNVLNGLITASQVRAVANSIGTPNDATSSNASNFVGLRVAGTLISGSVTPNTTVKLPGLGYVVLNEQDGPSNSFAATSISINMIDLYVTVTNSLGLSTGTRIIVAHADSTFLRTAQSVALDASSYASYTFGTANNLGLSSGAYMPSDISCLGGSSQAQSDTFSSPTVGTAGQVSDSSSGQITPTQATVMAESDISNMNLLQDQIKGDKANVQASAVWNGTGAGSATTNLYNFFIAGHSTQQSPPPDTRISLPGLGYVVLNEQYINVTPAGVFVEVIAIDINITQTNTLGLPVGARIIMGHADASVQR